MFTTTHWSVVLAAGRTNEPQSAAALEKLCRTYWYPLYAYLRRSGYSEHDAQDLTQGFFAQLLEDRTIESVQREKGKFRSFLLRRLKYHIAHDRERASAKKRGGGCEVFSLDSLEAEQRYRLEPRDDRTPEKIFEHRWAMTVLDQALTQLAKEFQESGKAALFERLRLFLIDEKGNRTYRELADEMGISEDAFKKGVQRMRRRYSELLRAEIAQTVSEEAEVEEELGYLRSVLTT